MPQFRSEPPVRAEESRLIVCGFWCPPGASYILTLPRGVSTGRIPAAGYLPFRARKGAMVMLSLAQDGYVPQTWTLTVPDTDLWEQRFGLEPAPAWTPALVHLDGGRLMAGDTPFPWRGITAFKLNELVANGREADARAYLRQVKALGFTVARVLLALPNGYFGHFPYAQGLKSLPRLLEIATEEQVYLQLVLLANTADMQTTEIQQIVEQACQHLTPIVALVELANEPWHPTQKRDLPILLRDLVGLVPAAYLCCLGAAQDDESLEMDHEDADGLVVHLDRGGTPGQPGYRDPWNMVRRVKELGWVRAQIGAPVWNNEPIKAVSQLDNPAIYQAMGLLNRLCKVEGTFHCDSGLFARSLNPMERECARAWMAGMDHPWFAGRDWTFANAGWPGSPVKGARFADGPPRSNTCVRAYTGVDGAEALTILLGVQGDPGLELADGWRVMETRELAPELQVLSLRKE